MINPIKNLCFILISILIITFILTFFVDFKNIKFNKSINEKKLNKLIVQNNNL